MRTEDYLVQATDVFPGPLSGSLRHLCKVIILSNTEIQPALWYNLATV